MQCANKYFLQAIFHYTLVASEWSVIWIPNVSWKIDVGFDQIWDALRPMLGLMQIAEFYWASYKDFTGKHCGKVFLSEEYKLCRVQEVCVAVIYAAYKSI
jgi:hypothetical protein